MGYLKIRSFKGKNWYLLLIAIISVLVSNLLIGCNQESKGEDPDPSVNDSSDSSSNAAVSKGSIEIGQSIVGTFDDSSYHLYELTVTGSSVVKISLAGEANSNLDTVVRVYGPRDSNGLLPDSPFKMDDDGGPGSASLIEEVTVSEGRYGIVASTYAGNPANGETYRLSIDCVSGSCDGGNNNNNTNDYECTPADEANWTIMIYGVYDCPTAIPSLKANLERTARQYVNKGTPNVRFVMLEDLKNIDTTTYLIEPSGSTVVRETGELNTGLTATLEDFINFSRTCYPARNYALHVVGHSVSAIDGGLVDYSNGRTYMKWTDFRNAIKNSIGHVAVLSVAACMSSTLELAYEFRDIADYMTGYQSFSQGYDASAWAQLLLSNPSTSAEALATRLAQEGAKKGRTYEPQATSAINLSRVADIVTAMNELAPLISTALDTNGESLVNARKATQSVVTDEDYNGMIDLIDWIDQTKNVVTDQEILNKLDALRSAVESAVVEYYVEVDSSMENPFERANGMSIGFVTPNNPVGRFTSTNLLYTQLSSMLFYTDSTYDDMATKYIDLY